MERSNLVLFFEMKVKKRYSKSLLALLLAVQPALVADLGKNDYINLAQFAHHDLGWHANSFAKEAARSNREINAALDYMQQDSSYAWTHEHGRFLYEYLKAHPKRYNELAQRVAEGRFELGAGYTSPYTSFVTNELLVRQFIYGKKWVEELFPNYTSNVFYNTDIPGLGAQMPQILKKSGVDYLYASRSWNFEGYRANEFKNWQAPDGTKINTLFMDQYPANIDAGFRKNVIGVANQRISEYNKDIRREGLGAALPMIYSRDMMDPENLSKQIEDWNTYASENSLPKMRYNTVQNALKQTFVESADFSKGDDTFVGEWPNKWFYENAASDNNTFMLQREADRYLRAAETLAVIRAVATGSFEHYPSEELEEGWRAADHACHGYAPVTCMGEFKKTYQRAYDIGLKLYNSQLDWLVGRIAAKPSKGMGFAVYNNLSWERDDVVIMDKPDGIGDAFQIQDENGTETAYQITPDNQIVFVAKKVPSVGYRTFYIVNGKAPTNTAAPAVRGAAWTGIFENNYFELTPVAAGGGVQKIVDKKNNGQSLFSTDKYKIGELYRFQYDGMGAGEQHYIWQPHDPVSYLDKFSAWSCVESGPVRTVFETRAADTDDGPACLRVTIYEDIKKIDFTMQLENMSNVNQRQLRLMFPVNANDMFGGEMIDRTKAAVTYEVPFGAVTVGDEVLKLFSRFNENTAPNAVGWKRAGRASVEGRNKYDDKNDINSGIRPREVQNWISASDTDKNFNVTFSSYNLGWDYQDATSKPGRQPVLQPVLLSHSRTCHGDGFIWNQPGAHSFNFSMTSGKAGDMAGRRMGIEANNPLDTRVQGTGAAEKTLLPETYSAFSANKDNIMISAIKKAEDNNRDIVLRFYEAEGKKDTGKVTVSLPGKAKITAAKEVNLIERETGVKFKASGNKVTLPASPWSIETARISLSGMKDNLMTPTYLRATVNANKVTLNWYDREKGTTFVVEQRLVDGTWEKIKETSAFNTTLELPAGRYQFRVKAGKGNLFSEYVTSGEVVVDDMQQQPAAVAVR